MAEITSVKYHISSLSLQERHAEKPQVKECGLLSIFYMQEQNNFFE